MKRFWDRFFGLDVHRSIWIDPDELGKERVIKCNRKQYRVKIPGKINKEVILRLRGIGRTKDGLTGNLYLHVYLNKGDDIRRDYWIPESDARKGTSRKLNVGEGRARVFIPAGSYDGLVMRYSGLGREQDFNWRVPFLKRKNGNYYLKLHVYPDTIIPRYGAFEHLSTRDMYLEGWVYRTYDQVLEKINQETFPSEPIRVDRIVNLFNRRGWRGVFRGVVEHLDLEYFKIQLDKSDTLAAPGKCHKFVTIHDNTYGSLSYLIQIHTKYLDQPFATAAILAHELCHVVYSERIQDRSEWVGLQHQTPVQKLNEEQTVDLLVFMYRMGEFQLRFARDQHLTLGYFNQDVFDRMQVIVSRKMAEV